MSKLYTLSNRNGKIIENIYLNTFLYISFVFAVISISFYSTEVICVEKKDKPVKYDIQYIQDSELDKRSVYVLADIREKNVPEFVLKFEIALARIKGEIKPELYGFGNRLTYKPVKNLENNFFILCPRGDASRGNYDCFDAAVTVQRILDSEGIKSTVRRGMDELGLFDEHYYVITEEGITIDATPLFSLLGARHLSQMIVTKEDIENHIKRGYLNLGGPVPLSFGQKGGSKYYSTLGIISQQLPLEEMVATMLMERQYPSLEFQYRLTEIVDDTVKRSYVMRVNVGSDTYRAFVKKMIYEEDTAFRRMTPGEMAQAGGIQLEEKGIDRNIKSTFTEEKSIDVSKVSDLKMMANDDMEITGEFIRNIAYCMFILNIRL